MRSRAASYAVKSFFILAMLLVFQQGHAAGADRLTVAVAANFSLPMEEIAEEFQHASGISLQTTISSTGTLFAQIKNGAPYDLFFAADGRRPERLFQEGLAGEPQVYAQGQAILWTAEKDVCAAGSWQEAVSWENIKKIGIANPETAPYGTVAQKALLQAELWDDVSDKLVYAGNVGQSFQYATMGTVTMSFAATSLTLSKQGRKGCYWEMPEAEKVVQKACIISRSTKKEMAEQFLVFLQSPQVQAILKKYGYR